MHISRKGNLIIAAAAIALVAFAFVSVTEETNAETIDGLKYVLNPDNTAVLTGYDTSLPKDVIIPDTIEVSGTTYTVCEIRSYAFENNGTIQSVVIPETVTGIGDGPFRKCTSLTSIEVDTGSSDFSSISGALYNKGGTTLICCPAGTTGQFTLPKTVNFLKRDAFMYNKLTGIGVEDGSSSYVSIDGVLYDFGGTVLRAYPGKSGDAVIPDGVHTVATFAFNGCSSIGSVYASGSLKTIDYAAFSNSSVTSVNFPAVSFMDEESFNGCKTLDTVNMPSVTIVPSKVFQGCELLATANLSLAKSVESDAFQGCKSLATIDASLVTYIGDCAFQGCESLATIDISSVTYIGDYAFQGCITLGTADVSSVTVIGGGAFKGCVLLTAITIPSTVNEIQYETFEGCGNLSALEISPSVTSIGNSAFRDCNNITAVSAVNVSYVGEMAFYSCSSLKEVDMPAASSLGQYAFEGCILLDSVSMPNLTSAGLRAFFNCASLKSMKATNLKDVSADAFYGCAADFEVTFRNGGTISDNALRSVGVKRLTLIDVDENSKVGGLPVSWEFASGKINEILFDSETASALPMPSVSNKTVSFSLRTPDPTNIGEMKDLYGNQISGVQGYKYRSDATSGIRWEKLSESKFAMTPAVNFYVYNGSDQTGVQEGDGYTLLPSPATGRNAGEYTVTATPKSGFMWEDGTTNPQTLKWKITPAPMSLSVHRGSGETGIRIHGR